MQNYSKVTSAIMSKAIKAVAELHENGIIHKNLSPDIILVKETSIIEVALCDFKHASLASFKNSAKNARKSIYLKQKQIWEEGSEHHDIYAISVMLIEQIKGTDDFKKKFKNENDITNEANQLILRHDMHPNLKEIFKQTLLKEDKLMPAKKIFELLALCNA